MKFIICPRCAGHGKIEKYNHVEDGLCFECHGAGKIEVEDNVRDTIAEIRQEKETEKQFNNLWNQYKNNILDDRQWKDYILCEGTENTTKDEERLIRINQYIEYKKAWKEYIMNHMELIEDLNKYESIRNEFENRYLNSRE